MKNQFLTLLGTTMLLCGCSSSPQPAIKQDKAVEHQIEELMARMTLEEKIGQMTQLTIDVVGKGNSVYDSFMPFQFDEAMLDTVLVRYKVGSILNTPTNTPQTVEAWNSIIRELQQRAIQVTGIPIVYGVDEIHGVTYTIGGTLFPQEIGMGATFNPELVRDGAAIAAYETRAGSIPWNFSPVLDLGRDQRWSRMWETYSEDSYLASVMGCASIQGYQGDDPNRIGSKNVAACLKHYMGYGVTVSGKDRTPSSISEQDMRERHYAPFLAAIRAGALSVMVNSGLNNGLPYHANYEYITKWLKEDLNWDGVVVTDWADINNLCDRDRVAHSKKEAVRMAINAGIDMSMVPYEWSFCNYLRELVEEGEVSMARIDDAVRRILRMKFRLNLFEQPYNDPSEFLEFGSDQHASVARRAAEESITLLKNESVLPFKDNVKILVCGPNANSMRTLNGGWTLSWQGEKTDVYAENYNTILEAIQNRAGAANVYYAPGVSYQTANPPTTAIPYWAENKPQIEQAVQLAHRVDYIVLCVGENSYCETPGNLETLDLSENQQRLAEALAQTGKPVILVLNEGRPRIISRIEPQMKAVLQTYLPGNYGGDALASILWGDVNPSGKLPYTYPKAANSLLTYDYKPSESVDKMAGAYDYDAIASVQWAFGFGLSYTTFEYTNLTTSRTNFTAGDELTFAIDVTNTGQREGKECVMLFSQDLYASLSPDIRRLRAFSKVNLKESETQRVEFTLPASDLAYVDHNGKWCLEEGDFQIQIGNQTVTIHCDKTYIWETPNIDKPLNR